MSRPNHSCVSRLSNHDLTRSLKKLVSDERRRLVEILEHLNEIERRKLHLELGFSSLYDYCVNGLHYSRSAADRRIVAARAMRRFPEVATILTSGDASLTTVSLIARLLTPANGHTMLEQIRGKSQRHVERLLDEYRPERRTRDRVRSIRVRERVRPGVELEVRPEVEPGIGAGAVPAGESEGEAGGKPRGETGVATPTAPASTTPGAGSESARIATCTGSAELAMDDAHSGSPRVVVVRKHEIKFIAGREFMKKLQRMKALLSNGTRHAAFEQVFEVAMDCYLKTHCPERRHERRRAGGRNARKEAAGGAGRRNAGAARATEAGATEAGAAEAGAVKERRERSDRVGETAVAKAGTGARPLPAPGVETARPVPVAVRDAVFVRDGGQCTFVGPGGRRCRARHHLHIDHIVPYAVGGGHDPSNLRLLCRAHNLLAAERAFGREAMAGYTRRE